MLWNLPIRVDSWRLAIRLRSSSERHFDSNESKTVDVQQRKSQTPESRDLKHEEQEQGKSRGTLLFHAPAAEASGEEANTGWVHISRR